MSLVVRRVVILAAGLAAGLLAWPLGEALLGAQAGFPSYLLFIVASGALYGALFGLSFGAVDGITGGVAARKWLGLLTGVGFGLVAGGVGAFVGQAIYLAIGQSIVQSQTAVRTIAMPLARGIGWSIMGLVIGSAEGIRRRSWKRTGIGALGGFVGGLAGGLVFEYVSLSLVWWARPAGSIILGLALAGGLALIERGFLLGTLVLVTGPLRGREYPLAPGRTTVGSNLSCTIALPGYRDLAPRHAALIADRNGMHVEALSGATVTVNEDPLREQRGDRPSDRLRYDDVIDLGSARLYLKTP